MHGVHVVPTYGCVCVVGWFPTYVDSEVCVRMWLELKREMLKAVESISYFNAFSSTSCHSTQVYTKLNIALSRRKVCANNFIYLKFFWQSFSKRRHSETIFSLRCYFETKYWKSFLHNLFEFELNYD